MASRYQESAPSEWLQPQYSGMFFGGGRGSGARSSGSNGKSTTVNPRLFLVVFKVGFWGSTTSSFIEVLMVFTDTVAGSGSFLREGSSTCFDFLRNRDFLTPGGGASPSSSSTYRASFREAGETQSGLSMLTLKEQIVSHVNRSCSLRNLYFKTSTSKKEQEFYL